MTKLDALSVRAEIRGADPPQGEFRASQRPAPDADPRRAAVLTMQGSLQYRLAHSGEVRMRGVLVCIGLAVLAATGCGSTGGRQSKGAIQEAIEAHLKKRPSMRLANMSIEIQNVKFTGDTAAAEVRFRSKQSPDLAVGVRYLLRRVGNHWEVQSSSPMSGMGMSPHSGTGTTMPVPAPAIPAPQSSH